MREIRMVDLKSQYLKIKQEIDSAIQNVIDSAYFVKSPVITKFESDLSDYLGAPHVIACGNGTDALQISLMSLDLKPGDEIIEIALPVSVSWGSAANGIHQVSARNQVN